MSDDQHAAPLPSLRSALISAASREHLPERADTDQAPRHTGVPVRSSLLAVAALLVAVVLATSLLATPVEAGVRVRQSGDMWVIELRDASMGPRAVESALRREGIATTVIVAPVGPSRVGQFVTTEGMELVGADASSSAIVRVPADRPVTLALGRAARRGEPYAALSDAYAAGEPLECSGLWGRPVGDMLTAAQQHSLSVRFLRPDGQPAGDDDLATGVVTDALLRSPDDLVVYVSEQARSTFAHPPSRGSERCPVG